MKIKITESAEKNIPDVELGELIIDETGSVCLKIGAENIYRMQETCRSQCANSVYVPIGDGGVCDEFWHAQEGIAPDYGWCPVRKLTVEY